MRASVFFADNRIKESFLALASSKSEDAELCRSLNEVFDALALDAFCGIQVPKRQIPKSYIARYGIDNLWKYNFFKSWRLMYSVAGDGETVVVVILEWLSHKEYERRFGY